MNEAGTVAASRVEGLPALQVTLENLFDFHGIDVVDADKSADKTSNNGAVGVSVSRQHHCLPLSKVIYLGDWDILGPYQAVHRQDKCVLYVALALLSIVSFNAKVW